MRGRLAYLLPLVLVLAVLAGIAFGPVPLSMRSVLDALAGDGDQTTRAIVLQLRLPRVVLGVAVGCALGVSGVALQGALRNALAEPYLLGVSGGAAVGAVAAVAAGASGHALLAAAAFAGASGAVVLVLAVARAAGNEHDPRLLVMAGVVIGAFANAAILVLLANAPANTVRGALWWMMGSLGAATWGDVLWLGGTIAVAVPALLAGAPRLDALALGEDAAAALGVEPERTARWTFAAASLLAAATVAVAGLVGFVGLVVPHLARGLAGARHRPAMLAAGAAGGSLVVLADLLARTARAPAELPLGAVTALLGVPFFLALMRRLR